MKTKTLLFAITALSISALAQAEEGKAGGNKGCDKRRAHMIEKFDKDGDGKISEGEREAAKAAMAERKATFIAKHDSNGDGALDEDEKNAIKASFIAKFDTDGDGKLNGDERKAVREAGAHFPRHKFGHKKGGKKGGPRGGGA
ncbi:MAG: hypothetical protein ABGY95_03015 [Rubritalea sp.]|uniref:hypothetical protein n=1 Tax=Rubritalea sp. TaxID=2109375 RepID=UPI0032428C5C